jgi:mono/diheme cytochrome c family protein
VVNVVRAFPDTSVPSVAMTSPAAGAVSGTITLAASASDNTAVAGVQFLVNGMPYGAEDTTAPYSMSMNTSGLANGTHSISARARDAAGNTADAAAVNVTVNRTVADTTAPSASISAPAAGATVSGTVTITASATDNVGVAGAQFLINGAAAGGEVLASPYSYAWNTTAVANGTYTLSVRVRDAAGNVTTSATRSVTVNNAAVNPNATYTYISRNITQPKCASCHGSYGTYTGLRGLVRPGNPAGSVLYTITNSGEMPRGGAKLSATELKAIYDWIAAGALNN